MSEATSAGQAVTVTYQPPHAPRQPSGIAQQNPLRRAWSRMTAAQRAALVVALIVLPCCGGLGGLAAIGTAIDPSPARRAADISTSAPEPAPTRTTTVPAPPVASAPATTTSATSAPSIAGTTPSADAVSEVPVVVRRTVRETRSIPYKTRTVKDSSLPDGTRKVRVKGARGVRTMTYEVSITNGVQTGKRLISSKVTKAPVTRVVVVGTRSEPDCDPNYSGGCVPIASDVDCAGGSGNGPAYVSGVVRVVGSDVYDLDRDNDGYGCD